MHTQTSFKLIPSIFQSQVGKSLNYEYGKIKYLFKCCITIFSISICTVRVLTSLR